MNFLYMSTECYNSGMLVKSYRYWLKPATLKPDIRKRVLAARSHLYGLRLINNCAI